MHGARAARTLPDAISVQFGSNVRCHHCPPVIRMGAGVHATCWLESVPNKGDLWRVQIRTAVLALNGLGFDSFGAVLTNFAFILEPRPLALFRLTL